jgi:subtilisin family serine protease
LITSKHGTDLDTFKGLIRSLDGGKGELMTYEHLQEQSYVTCITYEKAQEVAKKPFISYVVLAGAVDPEDDPWFGDVGKNNGQNLQQRLTSDQHLRILSIANQNQNRGPMSNYTFDPPLGQGQTIYILDTGFNYAHEEFSGERRVERRLVPNKYIFHGLKDRNLLGPNHMTDHNGHGTSVASVAGGINHGVVSKAHLVLIRWAMFFGTLKQVIGNSIL